MWTTILLLELSVAGLLNLVKKLQDVLLCSFIFSFSSGDGERA